MIDPSISEVVRWTLRVIDAFVKHKPERASIRVPDVEAVVSRNVAEALEWASRLQIFGMSISADPLSTAIPLRIAETARRFRGTKQSKMQPESYLLESNANILLLGDPGSGKTTTLKRLTKRLVLGDFPESISPAIPIVVRLRELGKEETVLPRIARALGFQPILRRANDRANQDDLEAATDYWLGSELAKDVISDFLRLNRVILIFDGLDEAGYNASTIRHELSWLSLVAQSSQIIVSCRSGDYYGALEGFQVLELCPLSSDEVATIVSMSEVIPAKFMAELDSKPYADLADRPLFLAQLLLIYHRYDYLPEQPAEVYRLIITLMLREWDAERGIRRISRYAQFAPDKKLGFLAAVAYFLTFRVRTKQFKSSDLASAYRKLHVRFHLPAEESRDVIDEIESHTGIIVNADQSLYEFSHLSLQEYLAAEYISRESHASHIQDYLEQYPAPVAIAIALSSDPSLVFASLVLKGALPTPKNITSLLARLNIEAPAFDESNALGVAVLHLLSQYSDKAEVTTQVLRFLHHTGVVESIVIAFSMYKHTVGPENARPHKIRLKRVSALDEYHKLKTPDSLHLLPDHFDLLVRATKTHPETIEFDPIRENQRRRRVRRTQIIP